MALRHVRTQAEVLDRLENDRSRHRVREGRGCDPVQLRREIGRVARSACTGEARGKDQLEGLGCTGLHGDAAPNERGRTAGGRSGRPLRRQRPGQRGPGGCEFGGLQPDQRANRLGDRVRRRDHEVECSGESGPCSDQDRPGRGVPPATRRSRPRIPVPRHTHLADRRPGQQSRRGRDANLGYGLYVSFAQRGGGGMEITTDIHGFVVGRVEVSMTTEQVSVSADEVG
jgi:hypothetical protein